MSGTVAYIIYSLVTHLYSAVLNYYPPSPLFRVISEDYSVQGVLSEEAAQGLHWLMYQLTQTSSLPAPRCTFPFQAATTVISFDVNCSSVV